MNSPDNCFVSRWWEKNRPLSVEAERDIFNQLSMTHFLVKPKNIVHFRACSADISNCCLRMNQ